MKHIGKLRAIIVAMVVVTQLVIGWRAWSPSTTRQPVWWNASKTNRWTKDILEYLDVREVDVTSAERKAIGVLSDAWDSRGDLRAAIPPVRDLPAKNGTVRDRLPLEELLGWVETSSDRERSEFAVFSDEYSSLRQKLSLITPSMKIGEVMVSFLRRRQVGGSGSEEAVRALGNFFDVNPEISKRFVYGRRVQCEQAIRWAANMSVREDEQKPLQKIELLKPHFETYRGLSRLFDNR